MLHMLTLLHSSFQFVFNSWNCLLRIIHLLLLMERKLIHGFHICKFAYLLKFVCNSNINSQGTFAAICGHAQSRENFKSTMCTFPTEVKQGDTTFSFKLSYFKQMSLFWDLFSAAFSFFCIFMICVVVLMLKWPPSVVLKCCLVFPSVRRLRCTLWRKYLCQISFFQTWGIELLIMSLMLKNQQHTLNMVSLNRNTPKTTLYIDWWNYCEQRHEEPNFVFPLGTMTYHPLIRCLQWS